MTNVASPMQVGLPVPNAIRVFVVEDHKITLWGLQRLISASARMRVVGTASSRSELLNHDAAAEADVILLDLDLGGEDSSESLADLRRRCPGHVLVLTGAGDTKLHRAAVLKGARGVLHKSQPAETILRAIERVHEGEVWLDRHMTGEVLGMLTGEMPGAPKQDGHSKRIASLTPREREIVAAMASHPGQKQIAVADELGMSEHTLRNHLTTIYGKIQVHGRLELYIYAKEHGLVAADPPRDAT
jgi:two-component system, NarL family, nitrate/nitrite response regulator NarL